MGCGNQRTPTGNRLTCSSGDVAETWHHWSITHYSHKEAERLLDKTQGNSDERDSSRLSGGGHYRETQWDITIMLSTNTRILKHNDLQKWTIILYSSPQTIYWVFLSQGVMFFKCPSLLKCFSSSPFWNSFVWVWVCVCVCVMSTDSNDSGP